MSSVNAVHVQLKAFTASFRHILFRSGYQISLLVTPPTTITGILMAAKGDYRLPNGIKFGYEFSYLSSTEDIERTVRFKLAKNTLMRQNEQGIMHRQVLFLPVLDIYTVNDDYFDYFRYPASALTLGRSQDIAWVEKLEKIQLHACEHGRIKSTLVTENVKTRGLVFRLPSHISNERLGVVRVNGPFKTYRMVLAQEGETVEASGQGLYCIDENSEYGHAVFMHDLSM